MSHSYSTNSLVLNARLVLTAWLLPSAANSPRFRVPVEPILSAAAAIGWLGLVGWWRRKGKGPGDGWRG